MTTTFFFCNTTTKALCRSPVAYSRSTPFCCFVSLLVLDFLWITSLNFVTSLTPESTFTTTTTTASKRVAIMFAVASKSFSFVRSNNGVSGGSGVGSSRRYVVSNA